MPCLFAAITNALRLTGRGVMVSSTTIAPFLLLVAAIFATFTVVVVVVAAKFQ